MRKLLFLPGLLLTLCLINAIFVLLFLLPSPSAGGQHPINRLAEGEVAMGNNIFLPLVVAGHLISGADNKPLIPDTYPNDGSAPPMLELDPTITVCASFIDITNFSDETLYIFWLGPNNEEILYKTLESGRHYWQHTYRLNEWRIRDDAARLVGTIVVSGCTNTAEDIFIDDLPPCGGILNIGLRDLATEEPMPGFSTLTDDMTIDLRQLPPVIIHVTAQDAVESIEVLGGGAVVALNDLPFQYPADGSAWTPATGLYTLIFNAYRKDDANGKVCDSSELTLMVQNNITPTPTKTVTATATLLLPTTPTPTATPAFPIATVTPSATPIEGGSPTPTATAVASCQGRIVSLHLYNLSTDQPVWDYTPLVNGMVLPLDTLPAQFNMDATLSGGIQSLRFTVNGVESLENATPYRYPGGNINPWQPTPGSYTIQATAYALADAAGAICDQQRITVTVVQTAPLPTATATPVVTSTPTAISTSTLTPTPTSTSTPPATPGDLCIGNWTWRDLNENGLQDTDEPGLAALDLYLWADDNRDGLPDRVLATTTSDAAGAYAFCGLQSTSSYLVEFGTNPQCRFTLRDQGNDEALDSDAEPLRGLSAPIQLTTGQSNNTVDAGYVCGT